MPAFVFFAYRLHLHRFTCPLCSSLHTACICTILRACVVFLYIPLAFSPFCVPTFVFFAYRLYLHCFACLLCFSLHIAYICIVLRVRFVFLCMLPALHVFLAVLFYHLDLHLGNDAYCLGVLTNQGLPVRNTSSAAKRIDCMFNSLHTS